jgi:hypothetical protein
MTSEKEMSSVKNEAPRSRMRVIKVKFAEAFPPSL